MLRTRALRTDFVVRIERADGLDGVARKGGELVKRDDARKDATKTVLSL